MQIAIIVAVAENNVIGKDNQLLWHLSSDLKRFKQLTTNHYIVMGRKTYESIGKPLPNRTNIIITNNTNYAVENCIITPSFESAIDYCIQKEEEEIFIIGGGTIYEQALPVVDRIYLTRVHTHIEGDTFFEFNQQQWQIVHEEFFAKDDKNEYDSTYQILERLIVEDL